MRGMRGRGDGGRGLPSDPGLSTVVGHDPREVLVDQSECNKGLDDFITI